MRKQIGYANFYDKLMRKKNCDETSWKIDMNWWLKRAFNSNWQGQAEGYFSYHVGLDKIERGIFSD